MTSVSNNVQCSCSCTCNNNQVEQKLNENEKQESLSLFENYENWSNSHTANYENAIQTTRDYQETKDMIAQYSKAIEGIEDEELKKEFAAEIEALEEELDSSKESWRDEFLNKEEEIGTTFDFMEGYEASVEEQYNQQLTKMAQGEFDFHKVLDDDGEITREEYITKELYGAEFATQDEQKEAIAYAWATFDIIDQKMGNSDSNGTLSVKEFESFYKNLDRYQGLDENGQMVMDDVCELDGIIDVAAADFFVDYINTADYSNIEEIKNSEQIEAIQKILFP